MSSLLSLTSDFYRIKLTSSGLTTAFQLNTRALHLSWPRKPAGARRASKQVDKKVSSYLKSAATAGAATTAPGTRVSTCEVSIKYEQHNGRDFGV